MKKVTLAFFVIFCSILVYKLADQYIFSWHYVYAPPIPFQGDSIVNPYLGVKGNNVQVANFHAHTKNGILNGKGSPIDLNDKYDSIGVDIHPVSQYHNIDTSGLAKSGYIPVYEHGYNIGKTHQLVIGANRVVNKDFVFFQTLHNKQEILERLSYDSNNVVVLTHPSLNQGYTLTDLKYLHFYDHLEILSPYANSTSYWDTVLSAGKKIFVVANDDTHDVFNNNELGRFVNLIYSPDNHSKNVIKALKNGSHAVVWLPQKSGERLIDKRKKIDNIKYIFQEMEVRDSSLYLSFLRTVDTLVLFGDAGKLLQIKQSVSSARFTLPSNLTYVRVEARFKDGTKLLFNPVYRSNEAINISRNELATAFVLRDDNYNSTNRIASISLITLVGLVGFTLKKKKKIFSWNVINEKKLLKS
jgi:hypothetical protein